MVERKINSHYKVDSIAQMYVLANSLFNQALNKVTNSEFKGYIENNIFVTFTGMLHTINFNDLQTNEYYKDILSKVDLSLAETITPTLYTLDIKYDNLVLYTVYINVTS